jgi:hypothetical protein
MSSADVRDVTGSRLGDRASSVPVPPGVTSEDELPQAGAAVLLPDLMDVEAVLRAVAELTGMPLVPVDHNGETARSFLRRQPVRIVEGRIEGGYTRTRKDVYRRSSILRHELKKQKARRLLASCPEPFHTFPEEGSTCQQCLQ